MQEKNFKLAVNEMQFDFLRPNFLTPEEIQVFENIQHQKRKNEYLGLRYSLREIGCEDQVYYKASGKPYLNGDNPFLSLSHSNNFCGVILASFPVGLDIELISGKIERLKHKFLNEEETVIFTDTEAWTKAWSIKEALFKISDEEGLDFKSDLRILEKTGDFYFCHYKDKNNWKSLVIRSWRMGDLIISCNFEPPTSL